MLFARQQSNKKDRRSGGGKSGGLTVIKRLHPLYTTKSKIQYTPPLNKTAARLEGNRAAE